MRRDIVDEGPLKILGARQNNLKNIDVEIPSNQLTVVTGVSGSGKSSLVFDTLYAEGQRRYVESLSAYARQFLERLDKPLVRDIEGLRPAIAIRQRNTARNPRSTVGTVTEIYDYLRLLFARVGRIQCRNCGRSVQRDTVDHVVEQLAALDEGTRLYLAFPFKGSLLDLNRPDASVAKGARITLEQTLDSCLKQGFLRFLKDRPGKPPEILQLPEYRPRTWKELSQLQVLVDRIRVRSGQSDRLTDSIETCYAEGNGVAHVILLDEADEEKRLLRFTERLKCQYCDLEYVRPEPRLFSFNNPFGACPECQGFGKAMSIDPDLVIPDPRRSLADGAIDPFSKPRYIGYQEQLLEWAQGRGIDVNEPYANLDEDVRSAIWQGDERIPGVEGLFSYLDSKKYKMHVRIFIARYRGYTRCPLCAGERLRPEALDVYIGGERITAVTVWPVDQASRFFNDLELSESESVVAEKLLREIRQRLGFLVQVGLGYLTLDRETWTLSGGEMQRIQLSASLSSSLVGTLYVLDEPSIGLHPRDESRLIEILKRLRDLGNTIVVVEHDRDMMENADAIIDIGPGAGELGGELIHSGGLATLLENSQSLTGGYLSGRLRIPMPPTRRKPKGSLVVEGASQHNLRDIDVSFPLGVMTCVTGVSGSGKSTLVQDVLFPALKKRAGGFKGAVGSFRRLRGEEQVQDICLVDQTPIGRTSRSNPATYTKCFDEIRKLFAATKQARVQGTQAGQFSFNLPGGRCETCQGSGVVTVEMQFLADVELVCEECKGLRFQQRILEIQYKGKNISDVLAMTVAEALRFYAANPTIQRKLKPLREVGLGYLRLGQSATTLSGGEAQRLKLASYLSQKTIGGTLFIFDEPTTGLHFDDIQKLLKAFQRLLDKSATVLVIEHNLDVIRCADWIIDLGPEGGIGGGELVAQGTPEEIAAVGESHTGRFLRRILQS